MRLRGSRSYLKQSDNSRSQDHSEVLPGEKVSTHTTDSVSQEEFPHINYSTPIQHTINQELNGGMDMSRTTLPLMTDDFYGWIKYELLKITDHYPYRVPVKGGFRKFTASCIITSNSKPDDWQKFEQYNGDASL